MKPRAEGRLFIVGGHEDKEGDRQILQEIVRDAQSGDHSLVIVTVATQEPEEMARTYLRVFGELGVARVEVLDIRERREADSDEAMEKLKNAGVIFFTGGDQLRITSQIGESRVYHHMREMLRKNLTIAGTSAGAAAMPETMITGGPSDESNRISSLSMAPGLGFIRGVVIDSHFAQRGRMGRLLGAVAQNPRNLGLGIDEDTAVVMEGETLFRVVGTGAVYVVDGSEISFSSFAERSASDVTCIHNARVHVLGDGSWFDLSQRRPVTEVESAD
jgi:cyanophycinase